MNNFKGNKVSVAEACLGTFFGTLVAILATILFYRLLEGNVIYLRSLISLDLGAMAGVSVGILVGRAGYREREKARKRRERRALRDWEGYKRCIREGYEQIPDYR